MHRAKGDRFVCASELPVCDDASFSCSVISLDKNYVRTSFNFIKNVFGTVFGPYFLAEG